MADSDTSREDRHLPASARRLKEARAQGRVPRSRDLAHALLLAGGVAALGILGPATASNALGVLQRGLTLPRALSIDGARMGEHLMRLCIDAAQAALPMVATMFVIGVLAGMLPGGPVFTTTPLVPNFGRLDPMSGLRRLLGRGALVETTKLAAVAFGLAIAGGVFLYGSIERFTGIAALAMPASLGIAFDAVRHGAWVLVLVLGLVAAFDAPWQWWRYHADMKMTHQEARDEHKQAEGNPEVKGRIKARQREMARTRMLAAVPSADVIVTNPTHYAVALRYDEQRMGAPRVVAKGIDHLAARIREVAAECGVPTVEAPPLARALYAHVELDAEVPAALYNAVAQVLAYVYQLRHWMPGRKAPAAPSALDVPADLDPAAGEATP